MKELQQEGKLDFLTLPIMPQELSDQMERENSISLNEISKNAAFSLIRHFLTKGVSLGTVYIDTVGKETSY